MKRRKRRRVRTLQPMVMFGALLLVVAAIALGIWLLWRGAQPRFMDVTIELGQPMPSLSEFTTKYADPEKVEMVTPLTSINANKVGAYSVTLRSGKREETVTLTVRDTTKPAVTVRKVVVGPGTVVTPEDFIEEIQDLSETTVTFSTQPSVLNSYGLVPVTVRVRDASGNETTVACELECSWLKTEFVMEMGYVLTKADLILDPVVDEAVLDQAALDHITWFGVGSYEVGGDWNNETRVCNVTVVDTVAPELQLQELMIYSDETVTAEDFVVSVSDASRTETVRLLTQLVFGQVGSVQTVQIEAVDASGNKTVAETVLRIVADAPPVFSGLEDIIIDKYKIPDYRAGVTVTDDRDGELTYRIDNSKVQLQKAGTYFVIYTATDSAGNVTEMKRRVVVENDITDTDRLVAERAELCGNDPKSITDFVRNIIGYNSSDWGGDDPVYSGFTKGSGNCVVSAECLLALLQYKGFNAQLIWLKEEYEPHYWVIVEVEPGVWRHVDATRGTHARYARPMTDAERLETLFAYGHQRYWDTSLWPACE